MIRTTALFLFVGGLAVYARRDWFVSLCGLILLMAVVEHPDAPKTMFGIQGLSIWNLLLVVVCWAWYRARKTEGSTWDLPKGLTVMLLGYLAVVLVGFARMIVDRRFLEDSSTLSLVSEYLVNTVKWVIPALLLFDGARDRRRFALGIGAILGVYVLLALQVIKWMPLQMLNSGDDLQQRALKILVNEVGYHRVTMSMMLAGASWALFCARGLVRPGWQRVGVMACAAAVVMAQALTGGRMGYATWALIGLVLLSIRDRAYLLLAPVMVIAVWLLVPAAGQRLLEGISPGSREYAMRVAQVTGDRRVLEKVDLDTMTAGRTLIWPYVEAKIADAPVLGYGMLAMRRVGLVTFLASSLGEGFDHPHNAYFEILLDSGIVGLVLVLPFYLLVLARALSLYADARSPVFMAAGGAAAALVLALLVASLGAQSFYPREGTVGMWCAIGLMLRVWVQRDRALSAALPVPDQPRPAVPAARPPSSVIVWPDARPETSGAGQAAIRKPDVEAAAPVPVGTPEASGIETRLWRHTA